MNSPFYGCGHPIKDAANFFCYSFLYDAIHNIHCLTVSTSTITHDHFLIKMAVTKNIPSYLNLSKTS